MSDFKLVRDVRDLIDAKQRQEVDLAWCKSRIQELEDWCRSLEGGKQDRRGRKAAAKSDLEAQARGS